MNRQEALQQLQGDMRLTQQAISAKVQELTDDLQLQRLELEIWLELKHGIEANPVREAINNVESELARLNARSARLQQAIDYIDFLLNNI